jgi:uncharacterized protein YndB with AHSA1/START domain
VEGNTISVERVVHAPAEQIFALIADAAKHASFDGSGGVDHTTTPPQPLSQGSKFGMAMHGRPESLFLPYRTTNTVIEFEPARRIAWQTTILGGLIGGRIWRYELEPVDGGTRVRETWDISRDNQRPLLKLGPGPRQAETAMRATLERLATQLEA